MPLLLWQYLGPPALYLIRAPDVLDCDSGGPILLGDGSIKTALVPLQRSIPVAMEARTTKRFARDTGAFHVETDVAFVGHADAAVHLDRFIAHEEEGIVEFGLC